MLEVELANCLKEINALSEQQRGQQSDIDALSAKLEEAKSKRVALFGDKRVEDEKRRVSAETEQAEEAQKAAQTRAQQYQGDLRASQADVVSQTQSLESANAELRANLSQWDESLAASPFDSLEAFQSALLPEEEKQQLLASKRSLEHALEGAKVLLKKAQQHVSDVLTHERAKAWQTLSVEQVESALQLQSETLNNLVRRSGELSNALASDKQRRENQQALFAEIERLRAEYDDIQYLHALIGSQKGDKFASCSGADAGQSGVFGQQTARPYPRALPAKPQTGGRAGIECAGYLAGRH